MAKRDGNAAELMASLLKNGGTPDQLGTRARDWSPDDVIRVLGDVLSAERKRRIESVVRDRTRTVITVVEGIVNTGNVSAVMRTAEAFGFQSFHVITGNNPYKYSTRTTQGAQKWLDVFVWKSASECVQNLKTAGYEIVVTHIDESAEPLHMLDFTQKTALVFGNELSGVSEEMLSMADRSVVIPSTGFVRSFNISVAAAIALHTAARDRVRKLGCSGDLSPAEQEILVAEFYIRAVAHAEDILEKAL